MIRQIVECEFDNLVVAGNIVNLYDHFGKDTGDLTEAVACVIEINSSTHISAAVADVDIFTVH